MSDAIREAFEKWAGRRGYLKEAYFDDLMDNYDTVVAGDAYAAFKAGIRHERGAALQSQAAPAVPDDDEYEIRADGNRVRKDRWETGFRNIVTWTVGPRTEFEIDDIVALVRDKFSAPQPDPVRFSDTAEEIEERLAYLDENACPHCGGSGHKDDVAQPDHSPDAGKVAPVPWPKKEDVTEDMRAGFERLYRAKAERDGRTLERNEQGAYKHLPVDADWVFYQRAWADALEATHPAESREEIQAQALEEFARDCGLFEPEYDDQEYIEIPRWRFKEHITRLRASQQEGRGSEFAAFISRGLRDTAGDDGEDRP